MDFSGSLDWAMWFCKTINASQKDMSITYSWWKKWGMNTGNHFRFPDFAALKSCSCRFMLEMTTPRGGWASRIWGFPTKENTSRCSVTAIWHGLHYLGSGMAMAIPGGAAALSRNPPCTSQGISISQTQGCCGHWIFTCRQGPTLRPQQHVGRVVESSKKSGIPSLADGR